MPRKLVNALSALTVKNAAPGRHADGGGLHLLVKESGARSWVFRYMLEGRSRDIGLGAASGHGSMTLAAARDAAAALRLKVKAGIDPLEERKQEEAQVRAAAQARAAAIVSFRDVAEAYLESHEPSWRNPKHRQQWRNTLATYVYPVMGDLPVSQVATAHVMQVLEPIWRHKAETASRVRGRIETILDAAKARGYREGENPARWRGHLSQLLPKRGKLTRGHFRALDYEAMPAFVQNLRSRQAMSALALEFAILTAARTKETLQARWEEISLERQEWLLPEARMKAGNRHRVPLSPRAMAILEQVRPLGGEWVFPSSRGGPFSGEAMSRLLDRMEVDVTVHGFRSAFRDWAAECTGYAHEVCEMALAHTIANKAEAAYRRGDLFEKRRRLMADWAAYCERTVEAGRNVAPIRGAA